MINKKIPLKLLSGVSVLCKEGLITSKEREEIACACKLYAQTGNDDELYCFIENIEQSSSSSKVKEFFNNFKEENYGNA